ncbi:MAG: thioesterase [Crocinitomicaceae bacterium]|nr:thioesterase [Crocinitomicaceae bacterium]
MNPHHSSKLRKFAVRPFFFKTYLLLKLPMGFLSGMKIRKLNEEKCKVTVPYKWINKNPFKSTFWAVLGMGAEMNTAALILQYTYKHQPSISTLPLKCESEFFKKATGITHFTCNDGHLIKEKINIAINSKEPVIIEAYSIGLNNNSETICKFKFTWSVKVKS